MQPEKKQLGPRGGGGAGAARARSEGWEAAGRLGKEREGWGSCLPVGRKGWGGRGVCGRVGCEARIAAGSCGRAGVQLKKWGREGWGGRGVTGSPVQNKNNYKWDKYRMVQIAVYDKTDYLRPKLLPLAMNTTFAWFWEQMFRINRRKPELSSTLTLSFHFIEKLNQR